MGYSDWYIISAFPYRQFPLLKNAPENRGIYKSYNLHSFIADHKSPHQQPSTHRNTGMFCDDILS